MSANEEYQVVAGGKPRICGMRVSYLTADGIEVLKEASVKCGLDVDTIWRNSSSDLVVCEYRRMSLFKSSLLTSSSFSMTMAFAFSLTNQSQHFGMAVFPVNNNLSSCRGSGVVLPFDSFAGAK